jgi:hypothetical protein
MLSASTSFCSSFVAEKENVTPWSSFFRFSFCLLNMDDLKKFFDAVWDVYQLQGEIL